MPERCLLEAAAGGLGTALLTLRAPWPEDGSRPASPHAMDAAEALAGADPGDRLPEGLDRRVEDLAGRMVQGMPRRQAAEGLETALAETARAAARARTQSPGEALRASSEAVARILDGSGPPPEALRRPAEARLRALPGAGGGAPEGAAAGWAESLRSLGRALEARALHAAAERSLLSAEAALRKSLGSPRRESTLVHVPGGSWDFAAAAVEAALGPQAEPLVRGPEWTAAMDAAWEQARLPPDPRARARAEIAAACVEAAAEAASLAGVRAGIHEHDEHDQHEGEPLPCA